MTFYWFSFYSSALEMRLLITLHVSVERKHSFIYPTSVEKRLMGMEKESNPTENSDSHNLFSMNRIRTYIMKTRLRNIEVCLFITISAVFRAFGSIM